MISWVSFLKDLNEFIEISDSIGDSWKFVKIGDSICECFAEKVSYICSGDRSTVMDRNGATVMDGNGVIPNADNSAVSHNSPAGRTLLYEYNVAYSIAYSVPVLYFNVRDCSGHLVSLERLWEDLVDPTIKASIKKEDWWSTVTQVEHPVKGVPYFMLHPCKTEQMMKSVTGNDGARNFIITWLSCVGPLASIKLDLRYGLRL